VAFSGYQTQPPNIAQSKAPEQSLPSRPPASSVVVIDKPEPKGGENVDFINKVK